MFPIWPDWHATPLLLCATRRLSSEVWCSWSEGKKNKQQNAADSSSGRCQMNTGIFCKMLSAVCLLQGGTRMISSAKLLDKVSISGSPGSLRRPDVKSILVANVPGKKTAADESFTAESRHSPSTAPWRRTTRGWWGCEGGWPHLQVLFGSVDGPRPDWWEECLCGKSTTEVELAENYDQIYRQRVQHSPVGHGIIFVDDYEKLCNHKTGRSTTKSDVVGMLGQSVAMQHCHRMTQKKKTQNGAMLKICERNGALTSSFKNSRWNGHMETWDWRSEIYALWNPISKMIASGLPRRRIHADTEPKHFF